MLETIRQLEAGRDPVSRGRATDSSRVRPSRIPELDGFRGLAILLVLTGHILAFNLHVADRTGLKLAESGVLLFFVLSGYLITSLLRDEDKRTGRIALIAFYKRRARRLVPALAVFLAVMAILSAAGWITDVRGREFLAAVFYVRNIFGSSDTLAHLWSLSLEEQFYTFWPVLFLLLGSRRMVHVALGLCILVIAWRTAAICLRLWDYNTGVFYLRPWFRFDAIAIGCWFALARLPKPPVWALGLSAILLAGWSVYGEQISLPLFITVQTILAAALLFSVLHSGERARSLFSQSWLVWLGQISYSLYLWQQIFTVSLPQMGVNVRFPLNILTVFALAWLSRRFIEEPFLAAAPRREARSAARASAGVTPVRHEC